MNSYSKIKINKLYLQNRYVISPMCQYSAENGNPSKWHYTHLLNLSKTGASLLMLESTAVSKEAKISKKDLCIGNEENKKNLRKLIKFLRKQSKIKLGIQISHAGRKGSSHIPWEKKNKPLIKGKWQTFAPSAVRRDKYWPLPKELSMHAGVEFAQRLSAFSSLLLTGRFDDALSIMKDEIAEPYRAPLISGFSDAKASLPALGAEVVSISGAGPTLFSVCKTLEAAEQCAQWLEENYINEQGFCHICKLDNDGTRQLNVL